MRRCSGRRGAPTCSRRGSSGWRSSGSRYIDFLIPGLLGMNLMGTGMWSVGFSVVWARTRRVLKRLAATPMSRRDYLLAQMLARLVFLAVEAGGCWHSPALVFFGADAGIAGHARGRPAGRRVGVQRPRPARRQPRPHDRGGLGVDELHHAADVDLLGRVLLVRELSCGDAAADSRPAADRAERRAARRHAGWRVCRRDRGTSWPSLARGEASVLPWR